MHGGIAVAIAAARAGTAAARGAAQARPPATRMNKVTVTSGPASG